MSRKERQKRMDQMSRKGTVLVAVLAVGIAVALSPLFYANYRRARVLVWGDEATATIVRVEDTGEVYHDAPELEITVEVDGEQGEAYWVTVHRPVPAADVPRYRVGAEVDVQVDPGDPQAVAITRVRATRRTAQQRRRRIRRNRVKLRRRRVVADHADVRWT